MAITEMKDIINFVLQLSKLSSNKLSIFLVQ